MFRDRNQFFTTFVYICLLSISSTFSQKVTVTVEPPGKTKTSAKFFVYGVDDFDTATKQDHELFESTFNSPGYESRGTYNDENIDVPIRGIYSRLDVMEHDLTYGVGPEGGGYAEIGTDSELQLTSTGPYGINYFGFHGRLLPHRVAFYFGSELIFELKLEDVVNTLKAYDQYFYFPNRESGSGRQEWPYAFVNVFFEGATFDKLKFFFGDFALDTDVHTIGTYVGESGRQVPVTTSYIPPKKNPMVAAQKALDVETGYVPDVAVRIEPPGETDTSARLYWKGRQDFDRLSEEESCSTCRIFRFEPLGVVKGEYSPTFSILPNSALGETGSSGKYFSTSDSLLNLTVIGGQRQPNFFGLYLKPLNRQSTLEFFLNGESIFELYLADVFDFIGNRPGYMGNPAYKPQPGKEATTERFVFVNVIFYKIRYDAVRFRVDGPAGVVASDNHIVGNFLGIGRSVKVMPIRTQLKMKVAVTVEPPRKTETSAKFLVYGVEDFDTTKKDDRPRVDSKFNSPGYESLIRGSCNDEKNAEPIQGFYSRLEVMRKGHYYGVGPESGGYSKMWLDCELQLTSTGPYGINYFGFHGYLKDSYRIEFYFGSEMIFELKLSDVVKQLKAYDQYFYNPTPREPELGLEKHKWPFVFVNVFFEEATFDKVKFLDGMLASDVHTVGTYTEKNKRGRKIPVTTSYIPPKERPMVTAQKPLDTKPGDAPGVACPRPIGKRLRGESPTP